jgi:hypothetical protein
MNSGIMEYWNVGIAGISFDLFFLMLHSAFRDLRSAIEPGGNFMLWIMGVPDRGKWLIANS